MSDEAVSSTSTTITNPTPNSTNQVTLETTAKSPPQASNNKGVAPPPGDASPKEQFREYKIDGKLVKMTQREADDYVSMSYVAQQRLHEAGRMRKELEQREKNYQQEPLKAFQDYAKKANLSPVEIRKAIEDYYTKEWIDPETLSKEELALRQREERVKTWEQEEKKREVTKQQDYEKQMTQEQINQVTSEIVSVLESAQLPQKNKFLVERMAYYMLQNNKNGWNAPKEMVLKQVVKEHQGIVGTFLKDASMDQLLNYAGQEFIDRVLQFSLEKLRESRNKREEPFSNGSALEPQDTDKMDYREVNRRLRDLRTGKFL